MGAERLIANNPRPLDADAVERIVLAAHAGDRAALRQRPDTTPEADLTAAGGAR